MENIDTEALGFSLSELEKKIGYTFAKKDLLFQAFVHSSFVHEHRDLLQQSNERLEFFGDAVLGFLVTEYLYMDFGDLSEGELSADRALLVDASACVSYAQHLGLEEHILLGKGERKNKGRGRVSILADLFESLLAAIYLDGGMDAARDFMFGHFVDLFTENLRKGRENWKAKLQDYFQTSCGETPHYDLVSESGPQHGKRFEVIVIVGERSLARAWGDSKKEAQRRAAEIACREYMDIDDK